MADVEDLIESLVLYVNYGAMPGSFLQAALQNDLMETLNNSDMTSFHSLHEVMRFIRWHVPMDAWRTADKVHGWIKGGGLISRGHTPVDDSPFAMHVYCMDQLVMHFYSSLSEAEKQQYRANWEARHITAKGNSEDARENS